MKIKSIRDELWTTEVRTQAMNQINFRIWKQIWVHFKKRSSMPSKLASFAEDDDALVVLIRDELKRRQK